MSLAPTLPDTFQGNAEWVAYAARVERIHEKKARQPRTVKTQELAMMADFALACTLQTPPLHVISKEPLPPVLYGYGEAEDAFGVARDALYGLRTRKCPAFAGNSILTASLFAALQAEPNPKPVPLNMIHTGAKGKHTPELAASIIKSLSVCPMLSVVAKAHGISAQTLENWRQKGAKGERRYVDFFTQAEAAIAENQMGLLSKVAHDPDWRAKVRVLELTAPETFKPQTRVELTGKDGGPVRTDAPAPITITLSGLTQHSYDPNTPEPDRVEEEGA